MWIALRPFRYRGTSYKKGDAVPAEKWPNKRALRTLKRIAETTELSSVTPESLPDHTKMKRADLNSFAVSIGIQDAGDTKKYPNRETLIEAIDAILDPDGTKAAPSTPPVDTETASTPSGEADDDDDEDPFADLDEDDDEVVEEEVE